VYALGVTLYEMATGHRPFQAENRLQLITAILQRSAKSPRTLRAELSQGLERVLMKALEKDRERRYQTARELREDLERLQAGVLVVAPAPRSARRPGVLISISAFVGALALLLSFDVGGLRHRIFSASEPHRISSLAVMPFANYSGDADQEYFVDGMTDLLITNLSRLGGFERVMPRQTVQRYKNTTKSLATICGELRVDAVVEGSMLRSGNRIQISARLIDPQTNRHLWANTFERDIDNTVSLINEVTRSIAQAIALTLNTDETARLNQSVLVDPDVLELCFRGHAYLDQRTTESSVRAIEMFEQAARKDSSYAPAYVGLALAYLNLSWGEGTLKPAQATRRMESAARRALETDSQLADAHAMLGVALSSEWKWEEAEHEFTLALQINPNSAIAYTRYGEYLTKLGRFDEAIEALQKAQALDPRSLEIMTILGWPLVFARRMSAGAQQFQKVLDLDPNYALAHYNLGIAYLHQGRCEQSLEAFAAADSLSPGDPWVRGLLGAAYAQCGQSEQARRILEELRSRREDRSYISAIPLAIVHLGLQENDRALELLETACDEHDNGLTILNVDPLFDGIRSDPRFAALLARVSLAPH
jgi:TolB-like protein/Flp pilus assembly protein TadD